LPLLTLRSVMNSRCLMSLSPKAQVKTLYRLKSAAGKESANVRFSNRPDGVKRFSDYPPVQCRCRSRSLLLQRNSYVAVGSKADKPTNPCNVGFTPDNGLRRPHRARSRHGSHNDIDAARGVLSTPRNDARLRRCRRRSMVRGLSAALRARAWRDGAI
jgi:hypothetical protein